MLTLLSLAYLALPYFLFAWGWLWWPYALAFSLALSLALAAAWRLVRRRWESGQLSNRVLSKRDFLLLLILSSIVLIPCGVGGVGSQRIDWLKHNAVLNALSDSSWPAVSEYAADGSARSYLVYYIAYYLPAAGVGKLFGHTAAHLSLFVWTLAGLVLCGTWITRLVGGFAPLVWAAWFTLGGMDALGKFLTGTHTFEWWGSYWQFSSNVTLLVFVPQHALAGWLATALIVDEMEQHADLSLAGLIVALTSLWSPFVTIGLVPLSLVLLARGKWRTMWTFANLVAAPIIMFCAVLFLASPTTRQVPRFFIFEKHAWRETALMWLLFCVIEFGIYALLLGPDLVRRRNDTPRGRWNLDWFLIALAFLIVLPCYVIGRFNDLAMRSSIPSLCLFWLVLLRSFVDGIVRFDTWRGWVLLVCLILGAILPAGMWTKNVIAMRPRLQYCDDLPDISIAELSSGIRYQYEGSINSPFFRILAPRLSKDLSATEPSPRNEKSLGIALPTPALALPPVSDVYPGKPLGSSTSPSEAGYGFSQPPRGGSFSTGRHDAGER